MASIYVFLNVVFVILSTIYLLLRKRFSYWAERGVVHERPTLIYGNMRSLTRSESLGAIFRKYYMKYKGHGPFAGFYLFLRRAVVVLDLDLVKCVMIRDFANFADRGNYYNERDDPLSGHLFNLDGTKWRKLRTKLSPTFTSGKMKTMFTSVVDIAEKFADVLGNELMKMQSEKKTNDFGIEMKNFLARYTCDVIGTCAFGLECNSLNDPEAQFLAMGKKSFSERRHRGLVFAFMTAFPQLARKMGMKMVLDDVHAFFMGAVRDTIEYREREAVQRNDFMKILLELKQRNGNDDGLTLEEIAAQAFVFFLAGFETSSTTMGFSLYELAINQDIQDRARNEIMTTLQRYNDQFTYECLHDLKYLQYIFHETLRKYSIAPVLVRKTSNDYPVPNTKHIIEKGTMVIIPVDAIHHDPDIYPNPEVFDPERFSPAEVEKRSSVAWLPFGDGPRNCVGLRFGEMQSLVGLAILLKHYRFSAAPETQIPIKIDLKNTILSPDGGFILKVEKI